MRRRNLWRWLCTLALMAAMLLLAAAGSPHLGRRLAPISASPTFCPALPPPTGPTVTVDSEAELREPRPTMPRPARPSGSLPAPMTARICPRGARRHHHPGPTGNRDAVILDLAGCVGRPVRRPDRGRRRDRRRSDHPQRRRPRRLDQRPRPAVAVQPAHPGHSATSWSKVNPVGDGSDDGLLACSRLEYTTTAPGEYTNGISAHDAHRWVVRDNAWYRIRTPGEHRRPHHSVLVRARLGHSGGAQPAGELLPGHCLRQRQPRQRRPQRRHRAQQLHLCLACPTTSWSRWCTPTAGWWRTTRPCFSTLTPGLTVGHGGALCRQPGYLRLQPDATWSMWPDRDGASGTLTGNVTNAQAGWFVDARGRRPAPGPWRRRPSTRRRRCPG